MPTSETPDICGYLSQGVHYWLSLAVVDGTTCKTENSNQCCYRINSGTKDRIRYLVRDTDQNQAPNKYDKKPKREREREKEENEKQQNKMKEGFKRLDKGEMALVVGKRTQVSNVGWHNQQLEQTFQLNYFLDKATSMCTIINCLLLLFE